MTIQPLTLTINKSLLHFILLAVWLVIPNQISAATHQTNTELGEIEINISGNSRTRASYINFLVTDCLVDEDINSWQQLKQETIEQCILNSRLFAEVKVTAQEPVIDIELKERWSLLPLPYLYSNGDDYVAGLFLMENNLFGTGKKGGAGGMIASKGNSYFLYYLDPAVLFSDWSYSLMVGNHVQAPVLEYNDLEYYSYESEELSYGINVSREVLLPELRLTFGVKGSEKSYDKVKSYPQLDDYDSVSLNTEIFYKDTDFKFYFNEGLQVNLNYDVQVHRSDDNLNTKNLKFTIDWQKQFIRNNAIQLQVQLQEISDASVGDALLLGGGKGFRGVEHLGLWVNRAQSLSLDYQILVKQYGYGSWTLAPFVDITHFDPAVDLPVNSFISGGIGGYLYLKNITVPGLGMSLGYNNEFDGFFASLSLGMTW